jgi:hypothetical protein
MTSFVFMLAHIYQSFCCYKQAGDSRVGTLLSPAMHVITMQYNPYECPCWAYTPFEYCEYCGLVCDAALDDFECGLGDWLFLGQDG